MGGHFRVGNSTLLCIILDSLVPGPLSENPANICKPKSDFAVSILNRARESLEVKHPV